MQTTLQQAATRTIYINRESLIENYEEQKRNDGNRIVRVRKGEKTAVTQRPDPRSGYRPPRGTAGMMWIPIEAFVDDDGENIELNQVLPGGQTATGERLEINYISHEEAANRGMTPTCPKCGEDTCWIFTGRFAANYCSDCASHIMQNRI